MEFPQRSQFVIPSSLLGGNTDRFSLSQELRLKERSLPASKELQYRAIGIAGPPPPPNATCVISPGLNSFALMWTAVCSKNGGNTALVFFCYALLQLFATRASWRPSGTTYSKNCSNFLHCGNNASRRRRWIHRQASKKCVEHRRTKSVGAESGQLLFRNVGESPAWVSLAEGLWFVWR
jgi:hypothetical protein